MADRPSTDQRPTDRPTDHEPVSLELAAGRLGITVNAARQRLKRGTLSGHKMPDGWLVVWPPTKATDRGATIDAAWSPIDRPTIDQPTSDPPTDRASGGTPGVPEAARRQLEAIRDEWLAPLVAQIRGQAEEIGRLQAERDAAAADRDRLRAERDGDRVLADRLVDLLQEERDAALARLAGLEGRGTTTGEGAALSVEGLPSPTPPVRENRSRWWRRVWWLHDR